jgi:hypothetical protein
MQTTVNVEDRIATFMSRHKIDLNKDIRFRKLHTIKWSDFTASNKNDALIDWL